MKKVAGSSLITGDVIVHLFDAESRDYWDLENLWSDARHVEIPPEPEVIQ